VRKWHRWISSVCMLLLAWVSTTGALLAFDELSPPPGLGAPPPQRGQVLSAQAQAEADETTKRLRLHNLLKALHTGSIIGLSGESLDLATGTAFIVLSATGIVMYFELLQARRRRGRKQWFWS